MLLNSEIRCSEATDDNDIEYAIGALMGAMIRSTKRLAAEDGVAENVTPKQHEDVLASLSTMLYEKLNVCLAECSESYYKDMAARAAWNRLYTDSPMQ